MNATQTKVDNNEVALEVFNAVTVKSNMFEWRQAVATLMARTDTRAFHQFITHLQRIANYDWYYTFSDDGNVWRNGEAFFAKEYEELSQKEPMYRMAFGIVATEIASGEKLVTDVHATWESDLVEYHIQETGIGRIPTADIIKVGTNKYYITEHGEIIKIIMPSISLNDVKQAAESGKPVVLWFNHGMVSRYQNYDGFYGWNLKVCVFDKMVTEGSVVAIPTNTNTRTVYRAGKIKYISELVGHNLAWGSRYYQFARGVKYSMEDTVIRQTDALMKLTQEELFNYHPTNSRQLSAKMMANLIQGFVSPKAYKKA